MEDIKSIANSIRRHHDLEIDNHVVNISIGRSLASLENKENVYWLTNREDRGSSQPVVNIHGETIRTTPGRVDTLNIDGFAVYKNTILGEYLIKNFEGNHKYKIKNKIISLTIYNRSSYSSNFRQITDIKIDIAGETRTYQYKSINDILNKIKKLEDEIDIEKNKVDKSKLDTEKKVHLETLRKKKKELEEVKSKAQYFIRQQVELRNQHILDPQQESIKRGNIFERTMIIDGGPGTGKTSALIQRIMFLKASSILEYKPELTKNQQDILFSYDSWIFFSPNELLRLYLKNNMNEEGLSAGDDKVKIWRSYKNELCRRYKLFNSETRHPFLDLNKEVDYFDLRPNNVKKISDDFDLFFFHIQKEKIKKIIDINIEGFKWRYIALGIKEYILKKLNMDSWKNLIRIFTQLNIQFNDRVKDIINDYNDLSDKIASDILLKIKKNPQLLNRIYNYLEKNKTNLIVDEENEDEAVDFEESEIETNENEIELFKKLKALGRKYALLNFDKDVKLTKGEQELINIIAYIKNGEEYKKLGELAYFIKYFKRIVGGSVINIFSEIPKSYKLFRKNRIENYLTPDGKKILSTIIKDSNLRIHQDEQSFLIYKINNIVRTLFNIDKEVYLNSNNSFISAFRDCNRSIIAIDEATDFSILDIIAMHSLSNPFISSVTLSGDLMQRMTGSGIHSWFELSSFIDDLDIQELDISYRQSHTLLEVAKAIYINEFDKKTNYRAFAQEDENEPKPLLFFSKDENKKIMWIANRIIEIYNSYGNSIPSIAIFISEDFEGFTKRLNSIDFLSDIGIKAVLCRDGQILGDKNTVRVFPLKFIKGLEFEAVFFHNIDSLEENDLLSRYIYVGLSRATFYLAITGTKSVHKTISKIEHLFTKGTWKT